MRGIVLLLRAREFRVAIISSIFGGAKFLLRCCRFLFILPQLQRFGAAVGQFKLNVSFGGRLISATTHSPPYKTLDPPLKGSYFSHPHCLTLSCGLRSSGTQQSSLVPEISQLGTRLGEYQALPIGGWAVLPKIYYGGVPLSP